MTRTKKKADDVVRNRENLKKKCNKNVADYLMSGKKLFQYIDYYCYSFTFSLVLKWVEI